MTDRTYTQAEADALIAGALDKLWTAYLFEHAKSCAQCNSSIQFDTCDPCEKALSMRPTPDAARLALEERENAKDAEIARLMAEVAIKIESFLAMAASEFELRRKVVAFEEREKAIKALLLEGFNIVSSAYAHVSHGGPTREEALAWIKKVEKQLEGQL